MVRIGAHEREGDPLAVASATGAEVIQFFLGDPQGWDAPTFPGGDAAKLRAALSEAGLEVFIHAPYGINVASANNRIRIPSRKLLSQQLAAAAEVGAKGLDRARRARDRRDGRARGVRQLAQGGGTDRAARAAADREHRGRRPRDGPRPGCAAAAYGTPSAIFTDAGDGDSPIGFCLDTCHALCGRRGPGGIVDRVKAITGRIDLVHCNNSRDGFGSGRDRHAADRVGHDRPGTAPGRGPRRRRPAVSETPDPAADIAWLREHLAQ